MIALIILGVLMVATELRPSGHHRASETSQAEGVNHFGNAQGLSPRASRNCILS